MKLRASIACIFIIYMFVMPIPNSMSQDNTDSKSLVLISIDATSVSCHTCFESFLKLCKVFRSKSEDIKIVGMFRVKWGSKEEDVKMRKIILRRLKGMKKANNLNFDFYLADNKSFEKKSTLTLFNQETFVVSKYKLPIKNKELIKVLKNL